MKSLVFFYVFYIGSCIKVPFKLSTIRITRRVVFIRSPLGYLFSEIGIIYIVEVR